MQLWQIDNEIRLLAPIEGVNSEGAIWFKPEATEEQRTAAETKMAELLPMLEPAP